MIRVLYAIRIVRSKINKRSKSYKNNSACTPEGESAAKVDTCGTIVIKIRSVILDKNPNIKKPL